MTTTTTPRTALEVSTVLAAWHEALCAARSLLAAARAFVLHEPALRALGPATLRTARADLRARVARVFQARDPRTVEPFIAAALTAVRTAAPGAPAALADPDLPPFPEYAAAVAREFSGGRDARAWRWHLRTREHAAHAARSYLARRMTFTNAGVVDDRLSTALDEIARHLARDGEHPHGAGRRDAERYLATIACGGGAARGAA